MAKSKAGKSGKAVKAKGKPAPKTGQKTKHGQAAAAAAKALPSGQPSAQDMFQQRLIQSIPYGKMPAAPRPPAF